MEINEKEIGLKFLKKREQELELELRVLRNTIASIQGSNNSSEATPLNTVLPNKNIQAMPNDDTARQLKKATISEMFLIVLKTHQKFMKVREIGAYIAKAIGGDENDWVKKLSRRTRNLKELDKIVKIQVGKLKHNAFWGSPSWLDSDGNVQKKYMYDTNSLSRTKTNSLLNFDI